MVNEIMDGVTRKLYALFKDEYRIYTENVKQGLEEPCFFVSVLNSSRKPLLGGRFQSVCDLCVQYFPKEGNRTRDLNAMALMLLDGLEYIRLPAGGLCRGRNMSARSEDGVLTFLATYTGFGMREQAEAETMETVTVKGRGNGQEKGSDALHQKAAGTVSALPGAAGFAPGAPGRG